MRRLRLLPAGATDTWGWSHRLYTLTPGMESNARIAPIRKPAPE